MARHIALVTSEISPGTAGGIGRLVARLADDLARGSLQVSVVFVGEREALDAYAAVAPDGVAVHHVDDLFADSGADDVPLWAFHWILYYRSYRVAHALRRLHQLRPLDVIEFPDYQGLGYVTLKERRLLGTLEGVTMVVRLHGSGELTQTFDGRANHQREAHQTNDMERYCLRYADSWIVPSVSVGRWYQQYYGIADKSTLTSVPPFESMTPAAAPAPNDGPVRILFYGKMQHLKGVDVIVDAFVRARRAGANIELSLVGGDTETGSGSYRALLEKQLPAELARFVSFVGRVEPPELPALVTRHDVAVFASRVETFCLAAHELNALGIPLVLPRIVAFADFFTDGDDCAFFDGTVASLEAVFCNLRRGEKPLVGLASNRAYVASQIHVVADYEAIESARRGIPPALDLKVSVIVPYFEMHAYVDQTLESVLASTHRNFEIIVVNDGSRSDEANAKFDLLQQQYRNDPRLIFVRKANGGLGSARNEGIRHARGDVVLPLDSDDLIESDLLSLACTSLARNPDLEGVSFFTSFFADGGDPRAPVDYVIPYDLNRLLIMLENRAGTATSAFRKSVFDEDAYDEGLKSYEDWELWWRLAERGAKVEVVPRLQFRYRRRAQSMVNTIGASRHLDHIGRIAALHPRMLAGAASQLFLAQCAVIAQLRAESAELRALLQAARANPPIASPPALPEVVKAELGKLDARGYPRTARALRLALGLVNRARRTLT